MRTEMKHELEKYAINAFTEFARVYIEHIPAHLEAEQLLMMFISDSYFNTSGKPSKQTMTMLVRYVENHPELQRLINSGDMKSVIEFRTHDVMKETLR